MDEEIRRRAENEEGSLAEGMTIVRLEDSETGEELFVTVARNLPIPSQGEVVHGSVYNEGGRKENTTGSYVVEERAIHYTEISTSGQDPEHLSTMVTLWVRSNQ